MNPLVQSILGSLIRMALGGLVAWLLQQGILQPGQEAAFYGAVATAVGAIAWAIYHNVIEKRLQNTIAALPAGPVDVAREMVKNGVFAPASTPISHVPKVQASESR